MSPTLALLLVSMLWGTTFVAVKSGLADASPLAFVAARFGLATLGSLALRPTSAELRATLTPGIPLGITLALGYATQTIGLEHTTPSRSAFVTGLNVVIVPLWVLALSGRRPAPLTLVALGVSLPGLVLLLDPGAGPWNVGDAWTLGCAVFFALHVVLVARLAPGRPLAALLTVQLAVTAVLCTIAAVLLETPSLIPGPRLLGALAATALLATVGTTWLQLRFQPLVDPTRAGLIYATEPVFAVLFAWTLLGDTLSPTSWIGAALLLTAMILAEAGTGRAPDPAGSPIPPDEIADADGPSERGRSG